MIKGQIQKDPMKILACCEKGYGPVVRGATPVAPDYKTNTQGAKAKEIMSSRPDRATRQDPVPPYPPQITPVTC